MILIAIASVLSRFHLLSASKPIIDYDAPHIRLDKVADIPII